MNSYFAYLWLKFGTILRLTTAISSASNQMETPLVFINNIFMDNISIENHTIQTVSVLDPWECFRHCAKHCDCVAFQVSEKICELLGTDIDGAIGNQVKKPGTRFYHMQQNGVRVSLCYCRAFFDWKSQYKVIATVSWNGSRRGLRHLSTHKMSPKWENVVAETNRFEKFALIWEYPWKYLLLQQSLKSTNDSQF